MPKGAPGPFKFSGELALVLASLGLPLAAADHRLPPPSPPTLDLPEADEPRVAGAAHDLSVVWFDPQGVMPAPLAPVGEEVGAIFRRLGVRVRWSRGALGTTLGGDGAQRPEIPVILLPDDPVPNRRGRRIMGLVPRESESTRPVWLFLSSIRWTLHQRPGPLPSPTQQADLSLAIARVIAHEVVHAVAPSESHTPGGLMHGSLDRAFLVGPEAVVDSACAEAFLKGLGRLAAPASAPATAETASPAPRLAAP
jgi:hypothetical protein